MTKKPTHTRQSLKEYDYHEPVLFKETIDLLVENRDGIYIDGTLGGGGHAAGILRKISDSGRLICFDADIQAIGFCRGAFSDELQRGDKSRIRLVNANYAEACSTEEVVEHHGRISGFLLDLGVSSFQLDNPAQGISHRFDAPLDMRFGGSGRTAADIINSDSENEIERILREFGEEKFARKITQAIIKHRRIAPFTTTVDLRKAVEDSVPPPLFFSSLARVFQALRIAVNRELEVLENTLECMIPLLATKGRMAVITYHSLEDRIVKNVFKRHAHEHKPSFPGDIFVPSTLSLVNPKPILAGKQELQANPRARSAKLRVVEKK